MSPTSAANEKATELTVRPFRIRLVSTPGDVRKAIVRVAEESPRKISRFPRKAEEGLYVLPVAERDKSFFASDRNITLADLFSAKPSASAEDVRSSRISLGLARGLTAVKDGRQSVFGFVVWVDITQDPDDARFLLVRVSTPHYPTFGDGELRDRKEYDAARAAVFRSVMALDPNSEDLDGALDPAYFTL